MKRHNQRLQNIIARIAEEEGKELARIKNDENGFTEKATALIVALNLSRMFEGYKFLGRIGEPQDWSEIIAKVRRAVPHITLDFQTQAKIMDCCIGMKMIEEKRPERK